MHSLGTFNNTSTSRRPYVAIIVADAATLTPLHALIQESTGSIPVVKFGGRFIETFSVVESASVSYARPSSSDAGLVRRTCNIALLSEHAKGYPYFKSTISKKLYQGGQTYNDVVFFVYANDRAHVANDIEDSFFLGVFKIDYNFSWQEENGITSFPLIQVLESDPTKMGATDEDIPEEFFLFNPWYDAPIIPKVYGRVPRIRMLNNFPSISIKDIAGSISGTVESAYTSVSTTIVLEKYADQSSVLRQLIAIGGTVLVRMADNEVIAGTLSYNSGTAEVTLTITARDQPYATVTGYTYAGGENYTQFNLPGGVPVPKSWSFLATVILNGKNVVQDSNGFMKASINFFDAGAGGKKVTLDTVVQLSGWQQEDFNVISHEAFTQATYEPSILSADFSAVSQAGTGSVIYSWPPSEYMLFLGVPVSATLHFNNPDLSAPGAGSVGDAWQVVGFIPSSASYKCYIRNGFSKFSADNVYVEGDGRLIKVPTGNITSVTQSGTFYGLANMAEIVLTVAPIDMDIGATSNIVYTDAMYKDGANEARTEKILYEILKESTLFGKLCGPSLKQYETDNWLPYVGVLIRDIETVSEVVDSLLFQCGITLEWSRSKFDLRRVALNFNTFTEETISAVDYILPLISTVDANLFKENTAAIRAGELISVLDSQGKEYIPLYFDVDYGGWEDPFYKRVKPATNRAMKRFDHLYAYTFKYIHDANSISYAIGLALSIGHSSAVYTVERYLSSDVMSDLLYLDPLDAINLKNFPLISSTDETDAELSTDGIPRYSVASDGKFFIMGAVCIVDRMELRFSVGDYVGAQLTVKQAQLFANARGTNVYSPPYPPNEPSDPPGDPNAPPNGGNGSGSNHTYGGSYNPMLAVWTQPDAIEIDSLANKTSAFTLTIDSGFVFHAGWSYDFSIEAADGTTSPTDAAGAYFTGSAVGSFPDKINDAYVPDIKNITLVVNYNWFISMGTATISRPIKIILRKEIFYNKFSPQTYDEFEYKTVNVILKDVVDITTS